MAQKRDEGKEEVLSMRSYLECCRWKGHHAKRALTHVLSLPAARKGHAGLDLTVSERDWGSQKQVVIPFRQVTMLTNTTGRCYKYNWPIGLQKKGTKKRRCLAGTLFHQARSHLCEDQRICEERNDTW